MALWDTTRQCSVCRAVRIINEFSPSERRCKPCMAAKARDWYARNKARSAARFQEYYEQHREQLLASRAQYLIDHREQERQRKRDFYLQNIQRLRNTARGYQKEARRLYPERYRVKWAKRRAIEMNASGQFTPQDVLSLHEEQRGLCFYCNTALNGQYHVDHKIPLSKGGTNWPNNLCLACQPCNDSKLNKTPEEFLIFRQKLESHHVTI